MRVYWSAGLIVTALLFAGGCAPEVKEFEGTLVPVKGNVTIDGKPAVGVGVSFSPDSKAKTEGKGAYGFTDKAGNFTLKHPTGDAGIEPGEYRVVFSKLAMPDGSPIPDDSNPEELGAKESIPSKYSNVQKTKEIVVVPPEGKEFTFKLELKK